MPGYTAVFHRRHLAAQTRPTRSAATVFASGPREAGKGGEGGDFGPIHPLYHLLHLLAGPFAKTVGCGPDGRPEAIWETPDRSRRTRRLDAGYALQGFPDSTLAMGRRMRRVLSEFRCEGVGDRKAGNLRS